MIAAACRAALEMLKQRGWRATLCGVEQVELQASGFRLRPWRADDAPAVLLAVRDPAIARWNPVDRPDPDLRIAQAWVEDRGDWTGSEHASFAVVTADDDALLGSVSLFKIDRVHGNAEVGYWIVPRSRGMGVATTAVDLVARWAFDMGELHRVQLYHAVDNPASCRVAVKAGFVLEGRPRESFRYGDGQLHDEHLHGRLATDGLGAHGTEESYRSAAPRQ
jgi:RimJ/RimL family protein N-acetyltransferase